MTSVASRPPLLSRLTRRPSWFVITACILAIVMCYLVVFPLGKTVVRLIADDGTGGNSSVLNVLKDHTTLIALRNTAFLVAAGGSIAMVFGTLFAWLNQRTDARMAWTAEILPLISLFIPSIASAVGWAFLGDPRAGILNSAIRSVLSHVGVHLTSGPFNIFSWYGLIFTYAIYLTPFAYLTISTGLQSMDPSLEEASQVSGASTWRTLRKVTLPSLKPAFGGAILLLTTMGFALFSIPAILGASAQIDTLPVLIVFDVTRSYPSDTVAALTRSGLILVIVLLAWLYQRRLVGKQQAFATIGGKGARHGVIRLGPLRWVGRAFLLIYLLFASVLPIGGLVLVSLQNFWAANVTWSALNLDNYRGLWQSPYVRSALQNSVGLAIFCGLIVIVLAVYICYITQIRPSVFSRVVDGILKVPAAITHIVMAIAFVLAFAGAPFFWGGTPIILGVAYIVMYFPQASFYATASLQQIGRPLMEASMVSGASDGRTARKVIVPLMAPALIAGWALIFVLMSGDITASSMLASTGTPVVGFVILDQWGSGTFPGIAALGMIMTVISTVVVLGALRLRRRFRLDL